MVITRKYAMELVRTGKAIYSESLESINGKNHLSIVRFSKNKEGQEVYRTDFYPVAPADYKNGSVAWNGIRTVVVI